MWGCLPNDDQLSSDCGYLITPETWGTSGYHQADKEDLPGSGESHGESCVFT